MLHKIIQEKYNAFKVLFFFLINMLFLYKYGQRQHYVNVYSLMAIYAVGVSGFYYLYLRLDSMKYKILFPVTVLLVSLLILGINISVDKYSLNVDRWSAMEFSIKALFEGKYPYLTMDHLNQGSSNFPSIWIMGLPFYLLGDVGYNQIFSFLLFSFVCYRVFENPKDRLIPVLFLLASPCYWWEVSVKSDIMSNMIIVFSFVLFWKKRFGDDTYSSPKVLGFASGFLLLTRGIMAVPLVLFLFKDFWKISLKDKMSYSFSFAIMVGALLTMAFSNCPSIEVLKKYNPLVLQATNLPSYVHLCSLLLPFVFSFKIKEFSRDFFNYSIVLMLIPVVVSFFIAMYPSGFYAMIENNYFDISYFGMLMPVVILSFFIDINFTERRSLHPQNAI